MNRKRRAPGKQFFPERSPLDWLIINAENCADGREDYFLAWTPLGFYDDSETFTADCRANFLTLVREADDWLRSQGRDGAASTISDAYEQLSQDASGLDISLGAGLDVRISSEEHKSEVARLVPRYKSFLANFARRLRTAKDLAAGALSLAGRTPTKRRPKFSPDKNDSLTAKQVEAVQIVGECKGNFAEAGRRMGLHPKTVRQHYNAANRKLGRKVFKKATTVPLPSDRRGQISISKDRRQR